MTGILEVARAAGVSATTVSRALRGLPGVSVATRNAVVHAAESLGYVASPTAAALPTGRTRTVGILAPWVTRWFFTAAIEGANQVFARSGYDVLLFAADPDHDLPKPKLRMLAKRVDGLLILNLPWVSAAISRLASTHLQTVLIGPGPANSAAVAIDDVAVGRTAAEHLISLGHTRIGFAGGEPDDVPHMPVAEDRRAGLSQALAAAGLEQFAQDVYPGDFTVSAGERVAEMWLAAASRPTAIVCASDEVAMGLVHRIRAAGVNIPDELSVVGVDGHDMARLFGLTTVEQPVREQGRLAAEMLLAAMAGEPIESKVVPTRLVVRGTTAGHRTTDSARALSTHH
ncbi:LacI family DNA-binding transcriptional regulator [Nakamurella lactea]|uniref:LacI family DNA-binding transcriptional regulator n=1 Tax=Nakamurella lactea TaxID=459515 RepID=UPI000405A50A|nr:LacI family DNA-binding transcriptional regulator [Nakamurella lactea]